MPTRSAVLLWYLARPSLYPNLLYLVRNTLARTFLSRDLVMEGREKARTWCEGRAISSAEALAQITGRKQGPEIRTLFPEIFAKADAAAEACPVNMGGPGDLDLLYYLAEFTQARSAIETGVAYGWSSLALLLSISARNGKLASTDLPYPAAHNEPYVGCVVPQELRPGWTLIPEPDRKALPTAIGMLRSIDLCHYDSDKSPAGRLWAYPRLWNVLRPGGIFLSDDIGDNLAFRDFCATLGMPPTIVRKENNYVGILIKTNP